MSSSYSPNVPQQAMEGELNVPRRFKTAFIFFSSQRHKQIKEELAKEGKTEKTTNIAKMVSLEWKQMPEAERAVWNEKSRVDKARYDSEMQDYNHARKLSKTNIKDPNAPRRPMSAFLAFSNKRRASLKREHPTATNADLSKMLSKSWKEIPPEVKEEYIQEEAKLRAQYKTDAVVWRKKKAEEAKTSASRQVAEEPRESPHSNTSPTPHCSTIDQQHDDTAVKQEQASLLASLANMQNNQGGMSYYPGVAHPMASNDLLLGSLHNRVYGAPNNRIDAAILGNLSNQLLLQQQVANNQHSFQLQQQLASSITGAGYPSQPPPQQGIHNLALAQRFLANNAQNYQQQLPSMGDGTLADAWINQQVNNGFPLPPGYRNNGWFR